MSGSNRHALDEFLEQIQAMKLHTSRRYGPALKKPLLLLLLISRIEHTDPSENKFHFANLKSELDSLIRHFGGRPTSSGTHPEQPFSHLRHEPFWRITTQKQYEPGKTVLISDLMHPDSYGELDKNVFTLLKTSAKYRTEVSERILHTWWPDKLHGEIRRTLCFPNPRLH